MERRGMELARSTREVIGDMSVAEFEAHRATDDDSLGLRNMGIHFYNVDNLSMRGFAIGPTNSWAIMPERVRNVLISDITLAQDGREPNQDGIHITGPAERIAISNIVGTCGDDVIAISSVEGDRGPITGVTVTNVSIRNRWCTGILRTVVAEGYPIDGIYASNLQLLGGEGYSEAHAVLKFGNSRPGAGGLGQCTPQEHANITIENVFAQNWRGPYCAVFSPVKNLTIRGARGSHTGAFFHNFGQAMDGLILEDCRTTLIGGPDEPFVTGMIQFCLENFSYDQTLLRGTPAAVVLDGGPLKDIEMRNVSLRSALKPGDRVAGTGIAGLRLAAGAQVDSLRASGLTIEGYETGVIVEEGVQGKALHLDGVTMRDVATLWVAPNTDVVDGDATIAL
jgi:hypothetical protein